MTQRLPQVGDIYEHACWFAPANLKDKDDARSIVRAAFRNTEEEERITLGPVSWEELKPGEARVPPPPENLWGAEPKLLVGYATVVAVRNPDVQLVDPDEGARYLASLSGAQLAERRFWTREIAAQYGRKLTDEECDRIIAARGPGSEERAMRKTMVQVLKP